MRRILLFLVLWMGCLEGRAQATAPKPIGRWSPPIVIERIYASLGDPAAALDTSRVWKQVHSAHPSSHVHFHIVFAAPTYLHSFSLNSPELRHFEGIAVVDGNSYFNIHYMGGWTALERAVSTLDLHLQIHTNPYSSYHPYTPFQHPLTSFLRDGLSAYFFRQRSVDLGQIARLYFYGEDKFLQRAQYPQAQPGRVLASSVEEPATRYHPTFLFDGRDDFGWGTDHGQDGVGESIALSFDQPLRVSRLKIWNGQQGSDSAFARHPRVRTLLLSTGLDAPTRLRLPDRNGPVVVDLPQPLHSANFQLKIESVYPGQGSDVLVVSELQLGDDSTWISMVPDREAQLNTFNRAKTKGTALGDVLELPLYGAHALYKMDNRSWSNHTQYMAFESDGSFHFRDLRPGHTPAWGRGGWEHFLPQDGVARVKVWGYRYDLVPLLQTQPGTPPRPRYFEAEIALDAFQIQPNVLLDAIPTRLRPDDFVPCSTFVPVSEDLTYKTGANFIGRVLYADCMPCLLREATAQALARAQHALDSLAPEKGLSFRIWDAYRPYDVQKAMWAHTPDTNYVANPYTGGSSHNKGLAVDLTLVDATGNALDMGTKFDDFSEKAHHGYKRLPKEVLANRLLLKHTMEAAGFVALPTEWWHYRLPLDLPIADIKFDCRY